MAIHEDEHDDEDLNVETETEEVEPDEIEAQEGDDEPEEGETPDDDELEISFGDEPAAETERPDDSALIKKLREENRRANKELADLRRAAAPPPVELGPRPTLDACDYDEDRFASETEAWIGRKAKADAEAQKQRQQEQAAAQAWQDELADFGRKKQALKARDFDAVQAEVEAGLSQIQQAIIVRAADDSAKVVYAIGKHPGKLADLAKITDPVKFTAAIVKLEGSLKVTTRRQAPAPDRSARGSAPFSASNGKVDAHLEKLEKEAERTNDRTKVVAYRRELRAKEQTRKR